MSLCTVVVLITCQHHFQSRENEMCHVLCSINSSIVYVYVRDGLSYFLKVVKRYLGGTWQLMALLKIALRVRPPVKILSNIMTIKVHKWQGRGGGTCNVKGNLLIKETECRKGVEKFLGGVQPSTSSFLVYVVRNTQNSLFS